MTVWSRMSTEDLLVLKDNCERGILNAAMHMAEGNKGEFIDIANVITRSALDQIMTELALREAV